MNVRTENLAIAASEIETAIHGLDLDPGLREATNKLRDALTEFRRGRNSEEEEFFQLAKTEYQEDGELEFDSDAVVSLSEDGGAYVQGWRWVQALLVLALFAGLAGAAEKALYRTHRLSVADVAVSCADGGRPVVQEVATDKRVIIVSCPFEAEEKAPRGENR